MKSYQKNEIPKKIFTTIQNAFLSIDQTKDFSLFDIQPLKRKNKSYFRLRKGQYRAIFCIENNDLNVILVANRKEVYKLWDQLSQ